MNGFLAALTSLLIAIFAAAFAAPYVVDWNEYRSVFEAQASKLAGRPVRVAGNVHLTILPVPEVRFQQVTIANRDGSFDTPSAKARAFRMALAVPPLLRGKIEARKVVLDGLSLRLGLDETGQVDWPRLGDTAASLPFLPADVSLKSVVLNDASLEVARPGEAARWQVDGVTGALSAESLRGPFKFSGRAAIGNQIRNVQVSLGRMSAEGSMPVKAVSRGEKVVYRAEGDMREEGVGPVFTGEMTATAPRSPDASPETPPKWQAAATGRATLDSASLRDLKLTMTRNQRPQSLTGTAELSWGRGLRLDAELQSQWLDLNLLAGAQVEGRTPAEVLLRLPSLLGDVPVPAQYARIEMKIAQISLGEEIISDFNIVARRADAGWGVESLEAGLPGGSSLAFDGKFARKDGAAILAGTVRTSGSNLGRLLQWASPNMFQASDAAAKTFSLSGEIESAPGTFNISDIAARLGESRLIGSAKMAFGERTAATVVLDARTLDLAPYIRDGGTSAIVRMLLAGSDAAPSIAGLDGGRWQLSVRADRLVLPEFAANDVEASLRIDDEAIAVERLSFRGHGGLRLTGAGRYPRADSHAEPALRLTLGANDADALAQAAGVVPGAADRLKPHMTRLRAVMPLSLTASLRPSTIEDGTWLRVDGTAGQTALLANARLYGASRYHLSISAENRRLDALLGQIAPGLTSWVDTDSVAGAALFTADFAGGDGESMRGNAAVEAGKMRLAFDGTARSNAGTLHLDGDVSVESPQARDAFALAGLNDGVKPEASGPLDLRAAVTAEGNVYSARDLNLRLNGQTIGGTARLDVSGAKPSAQVKLTAARFDLASTAALLLERGGQMAAESEWPNTPFAMDRLERLSGRLSVAADTLVLTGNLALKDAEMTAHLENGALRLPKLSGELYGGDADASAELRPARGRMVFSGEVAVNGLDLAQLPHGGSTPLASGRANFTLQAISEGLSPRGLMTVMSGRGQLTLSEGEIRGLDPRLVAREARAYLAAEEQPEEAVAARLAGPLRKSRLAHDGVSAVLRLEDGALRVEQTEIYTGTDGQEVVADARIDLTEKMLRSRWDLGARFGGDALPDVRVTLAGPVSAFGTLEPAIDADDLEQFLTVARVERNVETLERLRRERDIPEPPREESVPTQSLSAAPPPAASGPSLDNSAKQEEATDLGLQPLETLDPLPGFSTAIEEAPAATSSPEPGAAQAAEPPPADPEPSDTAASSTPSEPRKDPQVVEDARRELLSESPDRPPEEQGSFFEIFGN